MGKARRDLARSERQSGGAGHRDERLSLSLSGINLERAGDYNQRTVLQAIRLAGDTTRQEIAERTGLSAPAIANITARLVGSGLVRSAGHKTGGRGQPAFRLQVEPDGAFGVGLNIDRDHLTLVTLDLAGEVRSRLTREIAFPTPADVVSFIRQGLDGALEEAQIDRDRILGIGVAIPDDFGRIVLPRQPEGHRAWNDVDLRDLLQALPWPVHCDNDAAAAALGEAQFGAAFETPSFFYLLVSAGLGGGPVIDRSYHRGVGARSGEIGLMPDPGGGRPGATVQDTVSLSVLCARLEDAGVAGCGPSALVADDHTTVAVVARWLDDSVRALTYPLAAVCCLFDPGAILIGGRLPLALAERLAARLEGTLSGLGLPSRPGIRAAAMAKDASAIGAAILPFIDRLLPSDSILIQPGR